MAGDDDTDAAMLAELRRLHEALETPQWRLDGSPVHDEDRGTNAAEIRYILAQRLLEALPRLLIIAKERNEALEKIKDLECECDIRALATKKALAERDVLVKQVGQLEGRLCLICGATEPCELAPAEMSPCTFDPSPIDAARKFMAERDSLAVDLKAVEDEAGHASVMSYSVAFTVRNIIAERNMLKREVEELRKREASR